MKKQIVSFVLGAIIFGSVGVFAGQNVAYDNPYPVQIDGQTVAVNGYQINDYTYFKLRDIASIVGGFDVNFNNNTIQLTKTMTSNKNIDYSKYIGKYSKIGGSLGFAYNLNVYEIKDGKIFNELNRGDDTRKEFFDKIIDVVTLLGGDLSDAL